MVNFFIYYVYFVKYDYQWLHISIWNLDFSEVRDIFQ